MNKLLSLSLVLAFSVLLSIWISDATTYTVNGNLNKFAIPKQDYEWNTIKWCDRCEPIKIDSSSSWCNDVVLWWVPYIECMKIYDDNGKYIWDDVSNVNNLSVTVDDKDFSTNEWMGIKININRDYIWKIYFSKIQRYEDLKWNDVSLSSKTVLDYSDDLDIWFVRFSSSDGWKMNLSKFIKFTQTGNYRIYVEDKDWYTNYVQFYIWKVDGRSEAKVNETKKEKKDIEEEVYTSRSCKKYTIKYYEDIDAFSSPDLKKQEYFVSKEYFKRYIDSKNKPVDGCPTNEWWVTTKYKDDFDSTDKYIASNWKVYLLEWEEWNYYSKELDSELKSPTKFKTLEELKYYIRDRNFLTSMVY